LGDLSEREPAFQLVDPHLPANLPLPSALSKRLNNLPVQLTAFIGRARELGEVEELLATARLLTLTGTGGCGKTRLALRAAEQLLNDYVDGVWFVELAPLAEPELVPHAVASSVGVLEEAGKRSNRHWWRRSARSGRC